MRSTYGRQSLGNIIRFTYICYDRITYSFNDQQMLHRFIQVVDGQQKYNNRPGDAIPIIVYHRIDNSRAQYSTSIPLFDAEMQYLHDNGFHVISMSNLVYNNSDYLHEFCTFEVQRRMFSLNL